MGDKIYRGFHLPYDDEYYAGLLYQLLPVLEKRVDKVIYRGDEEASVKMINHIIEAILAAGDNVDKVKNKE